MVAMVSTKNDISYSAMIKSKRLNSFFEEKIPETMKDEE
jgi:hypothetical protein